jgi:choline kinase
MKAIMLAAGVGSRLQRSANAPPKVLLQFGGKTLLQRHVEILQYLGFDELVMGVGHNAHMIRVEIDRLGAGDFVRTVDNPDYMLGAIFTLWALRAEFEGPVVFMDGDVLYDHRLMGQLINSPKETCFAIDRNVRPGDDPVKLCFQDGDIVDFHKVPDQPYDDFAEWIGFLRLSPDIAARVAESARPYIEARDTKVIYEQTFRNLVQTLPKNSFSVEDITGLPWTEIDFPEDLVKAENEIHPILAPLPA